MEIEQTTFNYDTLDIQVREFVKSKELSIKARVYQTAWENGRDLLETKAALEHGQFEKWLKINFDWSLRTAKRMMDVSEKFKSVNLADLDIQDSALYLLAATTATCH